MTMMNQGWYATQSPPPPTVAPMLGPLPPRHGEPGWTIWPRRIWPLDPLASCAAQGRRRRARGRLARHGAVAANGAEHRLCRRRGSWSSPSSTAPATVAHPRGMARDGAHPGAAGGAGAARGAVARGALPHGGMAGRLVHAGRRPHLDRGVRRSVPAVAAARPRRRLGATRAAPESVPPGASAPKLGRAAAVVAITVALVAVFGGLFAAADPAFAHVIGNLVPAFDAGDVVARVVVFGLVLAFVAGGRAIWCGSHRGWTRWRRRRCGPVPRWEWAVPLGVLDALFIALRRRAGDGPVRWPRPTSSRPRG